MKKILLFLLLFAYSATKIFAQFITLTSPNGGEQWEPGSSKTILWNSSGVTDVNIFYSTNNGMSFSLIAAFQPNTGTYNWTVPSVNSTQCKIRVVDFNNSNIADTSDAVFTIAVPASLTITHPDGGENLVSGTNDTITWTSTGTILYLELYYSTDFGTTWNFINDGIQNTGSYIWTVPTVSSSECLVKIMETGGSNASDSSNSVFTISYPPGTLSMITPSGGEIWIIDSTYTISWSSTGFISTVDLYYSTNSGSTWNFLNDLIPNTGSYSWTIPNDPSGNCKIKVVDSNNPSVYSISLSKFTITPGQLILVHPNGGETLTAGFLDTILWTSAGSISTIDLLYTTDGGLTWNFLNDFIANDGYYIWTVPNSPSTTCRVKIQDTQYPGTISDQSSMYFTIAGAAASVSLISPNGGEQWPEGSTQEIKWSSSGITSNVILKYSNNYGQTWSLIAGAAGNTGSYMWTIPNNPQCSTLVQISDYADTTIRDVSNGAFCITSSSASLTLTSPDGGENLAIGNTYSITWTSSGSISTVDLYYSTDGGSNWNFINDFITNSGSYNWTVPNDPSANCKIKIASTDDPLNVYDISNAAFTIAPAVSGAEYIITSPNGGESWYAQSYHYIYWTYDSVSNYVNLDYSLNNGSTWIPIVNGTYNYGYYNWYLPNSPSANCLVRVSDYYDTTVYDVCDNVFTILPAPATITVTTPNTGNESWAVGSSQYVYWNSQYVDSVKIEYSTNNGSSWNLVTAAYTAANGYYLWTIPNTPSNFCRVRISQAGNPSINDISDNVFKIVFPVISLNTPNGGENWTGNSYQYIYWNSTGLSSYVKLDYSIDNGGTWTNISSWVYNNGSYNWYVPNTPSTQCLVKVSDNNNFSLADSSNATFTIVAATPSLTITTPNGNEQWLTGSSQYIYWSASNSNNVKLEYSIDNGMSWNTIISSTAAGNGSYYWNPVPSTPSNLCLVRISDVNQPAYFDISNNTFSLLAPYITVTDPNGGETYYTGTNRYIYWNYGGTSNYVSIDYSTNGGSTWIPIVAGASNSGNYYWNVPNTPSQNCRMRISDYYNSSISDSSDYDFRIDTNSTTGSITLSTPNGGQQWIAGSGNYIYWSAQYVDSVDIYYSINNGSTYTLIASGIAASSGYYYWNPLPSVSSNQCRVKVASKTNPSIYDASNSTFSILVPTITLTTPDGGESWAGGTYHGIYWNSQAVTYVRIDYSIDNGANWTNITNGISNSGNYNWLVPDNPSSQCLVKVMDYYNNAIGDSGNAVFTITPAIPIFNLTAPNGGENILVGSSYGIQWNSSYADSVKLEYSTDNGSTWTLIISSTPAGNNYYTWNPVPNTPSSQCLVKISDASNAAWFDKSSYAFTISLPNLTVITPNGGESWTANSYKYIYWTGSVVSNYIKLDYSVNGGSSWNSIITSTYNSGQYQWYVPDSVSVNCLIKISDAYDTSVTDVSDGVFSINAPLPSITVSTPNGGQTWYAGTSQYIYWSSSYVSNVKLEYSINNGNSWTTIVASTTASNGYYSWAIPYLTSNLCKVRISSVSDSTLYDISDNVFTIAVPYITVTTPNGGETWTVGTYQYIYWNSTGVSNVNLSYSIDSGASWINIINGTYNYNNYQWYIPNTPSSTCLIKVSNYYDTSVVDISNAVFTIGAPVPTVTVTTPNGGQTWYTGSTQYIYWTSAYISNVRIEYSTNSGSTWTTVVASTNASTGNYAWPVPNTPSTNCLVKISDVSDTSLYDISNSFFTIAVPSIVVTDPNGGEQWTGNNYQYIYWNSTGASSYVNISYTINSGASWSAVATGTYNYGYYYWYVPNTPSANCLVQVSDYYDTTITDVSDSVFTISAPVPTLTLSTPNGGETWYVGTSQYIYWQSSLVSNIKIEYSINNGSAWNTVISSTSASNGSYYWPVPNNPSTNCLVKITDVSDTSLYDISNYTFTIDTPYVTVTTPGGGEMWNCSAYYYIYWESAGLSSYVNLEYSTDGGSTWTSIANGTYNYGYYNWYVPAITSTNCKIRVTDYYTSSLFDVSDSAFQINCSNQSITVQTPNGGEQWGVGTGNYIYWTSANVGNVTLEYSVNAGSGWTTIATGVANNGYYWWTVPNSPSTQCLVRISDVNNSSIYDVSNYTFSIVNPLITVIDPNGGEQWTAGTSQYISWTSTGVSSYVNIYYSTDNGNTWNTVANSISNSGYYSWTVPNTPSPNCKIKITDYYNSSLSDVSDTTFTILAPPPSLTLTDPNGGEVFSVGSTQYIYWSSTSINFVKLEYSINGGSNWNVIISSTAASNGYYSWPVPNTPSNQALVRISDAANPSMNDQSNGYFSIVAPSITVTTPNGGETWAGLTYQYIYWNSVGVSNYVTIEYSINSGASWNIVANGIYNYGYYNWSVPNTPSAICLVRIKDYYNNSIWDKSDSTFTISAAPASIVVNSPNGGESWGVGTVKNITWSSSAVTNVKIEYSVNGGSFWNVIIASTPASSGYYSWPVPNNPSSNCFVKITDVSNSSVSDQSNYDFTIVSPSITVTSPNGGESWTAGTGQYIYWTSSGISSYVNIQYSSDSGSTWITVAASAYNSGSYWWNVPNTPSTKCLVRVQDYNNSSVFDISNSVFSIISPPPSITITSPNGGETWVVGSAYYIYWNSTGVSNVKIEYSTNGGAAWNIIIASTGNSGSYNWPVPNSPSSSCLIRVSDVNSTGTNDVSNNYFTITSPYITLTQPNGGEVLQAGNGYYITWTSAGVSYVKIEYSINSGNSWNTIVSSTYNNGYYYWTVPNDSSTNCLVKINSTTNPSLVNDQSDNTFSIIPPVPAITLNSPNSGEYWYVGYQYYITWSSNALSNVKLEYSTDGGGSWSVIIASTAAGSGFYYWPVPNTPSVNCKVRISDAANAALNDVSYGVFTIATPVPSITVNYPNGGENLLEGSYQYISWSKNFVNNVTVEYSVDSGASWNILTTNSSSTYYYWNIPGIASTNCFVKVTSSTDGSVSDISDAVFSISLYVPNTNTITTDSIQALPFCKEDTFMVYFTANGVFNNGNVFTAQLSDSNGNFYYPLGIGSVTDTVSGGIACVVPSYVLNGNGYRIRVVSSDLSTTGSDNGSDIVISSPEFDFAASETIKYLPDGNVQFSFIGDTINVMSYQWSFGNGDSATVAEPSYTYSFIGYYTVDLTVTDTNGCDINLNKYNYMRIEQLLPNTQLSTNTTVDLTDVFFSDVSTGIMTMADGNCLITLDSGNTWTISYTGLTGLAASVSMQPGYWFITGANGSIVYSVDNGLSWLSQFTGTLETFLGSSFSAPNFGFSVGTNGIVYNYDGTGWIAQSSGIAATLNSVYTLGNTAYSVGNNGSILYYNGSGWTTQSAPVVTNLNSVFFTGNSNGLAVGDNGYILNYDGIDWNVALSGVDVNFSSVTAYGDSAWAVSNSGVIYWSDDAGQSWMRYSVGSTTDLTGITFVKSGGKAASSSTGYIGGKGGEGRMFGSTEEDTATSVAQTVRAKNTFHIYPNPALDILYLETMMEQSERILVQLRDINGNLVKAISDAEVSGFYREQVDVSALASGVYFMHILQGDKFWVKKVVIH